MLLSGQAWNMEFLFIISISACPFFFLIYMLHIGARFMNSTQPTLAFCVVANKEIGSGRHDVLLLADLQNIEPFSLILGGLRV